MVGCVRSLAFVVVFNAIITDKSNAVNALSSPRVNFHQLYIDLLQLTKQTWGKFSSQGAYSILEVLIKAFLERGLYTEGLNGDFSVCKWQ